MTPFLSTFVPMLFAVACGWLTWRAGREFLACLAASIRFWRDWR